MNKKYYWIGTYVDIPTQFKNEKGTISYVGPFESIAEARKRKSTYVKPSSDGGWFANIFK